jgi:hypothetical protein
MAEIAPLACLELVSGLEGIVSLPEGSGRQRGLALFEEATDSGVWLQGDGDSVGLARFGVRTGSGEEFGAGNPVGLVLGEASVGGEIGHGIEGGGCAAYFGDGQGAIDGDHRRFSEREEGVIKLDDQGPVLLAGAAAMDMGRLQRSLQLKAADGAQCAGAMEQCFGFGNLLNIPQGGVLLGEGNELAGLGAAGAAAGFSVQQQGEKTESFGLIRKQLGYETGKIDGFFGEIAADDIGAAGIGPTLGECGVDGVEDCVQAGWKLLARGKGIPA